MWNELRPAIVLVALLTVTTGMVYPVVVTVIAQVVFHPQAGGSLIEQNGIAVGSALIGQGFSEPAYFHPRPSAAGTNGYDATASGGSNLGPTNKSFIEQVGRLSQELAMENPGRPVPVELVTASGSGLDPHLSPAAAEFQVPRVARARGLPEEQVRDLVHRYVEGRQFGLLGEPRVNVLMLNLALDRTHPTATP